MKTKWKINHHSGAKLKEKPQYSIFSFIIEYLFTDILIYANLHYAINTLIMVIEIVSTRAAAIVIVTDL